MARTHRVEVGLVVRFPTETLTTQQLSRLFQYFDFLTADLLQLELYRHGRYIPPRPRVPRPAVSAVQMQSPIEISVEGSGLVALGMGGGLTLLYYALRHPEQIGGWVPSVVKGWRGGWSELARAERDAALEHANRLALTTGDEVEDATVASATDVAPVDSRAVVERRTSAVRNRTASTRITHDDPLTDLVRRTAADARRLEEVGGRPTVEAINVSEDLPQE